MIYRVHQWIRTTIYYKMMVIFFTYVNINVKYEIFMAKRTLRGRQLTALPYIPHQHAHMGPIWEFIGLYGYYLGLGQICGSPYGTHLGVYWVIWVLPEIGTHMWFPIWDPSGSLLGYIGTT